MWKQNQILEDLNAKARVRCYPESGMKPFSKVPSAPFES